MKGIHLFEADDGTTFATSKECKRYEEIVSLSSLLGNLNPTDVHAALIREHAELADAFERAGNIIAAKRRESGALKRKTANSHSDDALEKGTKAMEHETGAQGSLKTQTK